MTTQNHIDRLRKDIASLRLSDAREGEKEAKANARYTQADQGARRANNPAMQKSKTREAERAQRDIDKIKSNRAKLAVKIANKISSLESYERRMALE